MTTEAIPDGVPVELRKRLAADLQFDTIGESIGFFRFEEVACRRLASLAAGYVMRSCAHMPQEAVRDMLQERSQILEIADVTGTPWIEIDFPNDVTRAETAILPRLQPLA